jgi:hypothetical protein
MTASFVGHKAPRADASGASGSEAVRVGRSGPDARSAAADLAPDGAVTDEIEGRASKKEASELRSATILVDRLNMLGANWSHPEARSGLEDGVDCIAHGADGKTLRIQVTTPEREIWARLRNERSVGRANPSVDRAVEAQHGAIKAKALLAGRENIVLALDATDSPRYALRAVVDEFRTRHSVWAASVGYLAIWVVGPVADMVYRLDYAGSDVLRPDPTGGRKSGLSVDERR